MAKAALVTGAAKRIGRQVALALAGEGYDIALHYSGSEDKAREAARMVEERGVRCELFQCDFSDLDEVLGLVPRVAGSMEGLSVLVNNASIFERLSVDETGPESFSRTMTINFTAPFFLSRDFARHADSGQIVNLLDTRINRNNYHYAVYSITKKALAELTMLCAREFAPRIRVNGVAPGLILPPPGEDERYLEKMAARVPLRRTGAPEYIADAVLFLVRQDYITGEIIHVDGGEKLVP